MSLFDTVIARVLWRHVTHLLQNNKDLGLSWTSQPPPSSRCKAQSCRCKRAHSNTRKPMKNIKRYLLNMAYLNSFKIKTKQKNCPDLANIEFKIASHPSTYPINALLTPRFLLHWTASHLNMCACEKWSDKPRLESHIHCSRYFSAKFCSDLDLTHPCGISMPTSHLNLNLTHPGGFSMPIIQGLGDPAALDSWTVDCGLPVFEVGASTIGRGARVAPDLFKS